MISRIALLTSWFCLSWALTLANSAQAQRNEILEAYVFQGKDIGGLQRELSNKSNVLIEACSEGIQLTDAQKDKLKFACKGDVLRMMQEIAEIDVHTRNVKMEEIGRNQDEMQRIWPIVMPARQRIEEGLHGKGSLFDKTLKSILNAEQLDQFEKHNRLRTQRLTQSLVKLTLIEFEKSVPLTRVQREKLMEVVQASKQPKSVSDNMASYVGMAILAKLPDKEVQKILSDEQFRIFKKTFQNAANFGGIAW